MISINLSKLAGMAGFEPTFQESESRALTTVLHPYGKLAGYVGIEPTPSALEADVLGR